ncbi:MazG-like family protein [Micromonospora sp. SH-82]|uniref:MazG-like family protein n=1 Tax=Micromonospora sp. SH-82 TaxID=3132938 RepID=UPI003EBD6C25
MTDTYDVVRRFAAHLAHTNGDDREQQTLQILKIVEEAGEVAAAWIGTVGQNPRKGVTHTVDDVAAELADVAFTALVAIAGLGRDPEQVMDDCSRKVADRCR